MERNCNLNIRFDFYSLNILKNKSSQPVNLGDIRDRKICDDDVFLVRWCGRHWFQFPPYKSSVLYLQDSVGRRPVLLWLYKKQGKWPVRSFRQVVLLLAHHMLCQLYLRPKEFSPIEQNSYNLEDHQHGCTMFARQLQRPVHICVNLLAVLQPLHGGYPSQQE